MAWLSVLQPILQFACLVTKSSSNNAKHRNWLSKTIYMLIIWETTNQKYKSDFFFIQYEVTEEIRQYKKQNPLLNKWQSVALGSLTNGL